MAAYTYRCEDNHIIEINLSLAEDKPAIIDCFEVLESGTLCTKPAKRVFNFAGFKI